jgi:predicted nucleic acid-binding protein
MIAFRKNIQSLVEAQGTAVLSTQVLQEFCSVITGKYNADKVNAREAFLNYTKLHVVAPDLSLIEAAIHINILDKVSFWDALIIAAAERARCVTLYSEDLNHGQSIRGIKIIDPFV